MTRPPLRLVRPGQLPAPTTGNDSLQVLNDAVDQLARLRTTYWPGDSAVHLTPWPASSPRPSNYCPPPSTTPATKSSPGPRSANSSAPPPPPQPAATGTTHDQLDNDHPHNAADRAVDESWLGRVACGSRGVGSRWWRSLASVWFASAAWRSHGGDR